MKTIAAFLVTIVCVSPLAAQTRPPAQARPPAAPLPPYPAFSARAFAMFSQQQFAAKNSFESVFGESVGPFRGGGADFVLDRNFFVEIGLSRFEKTGQRLFRFENTNFPLAIPLTVKVTPLEVIGGYRFRHWRKVIPYAGVGLGSFKYEETATFNTDDENVDIRHNGLVLIGGAEFRIFRWLGIGADAHFTRVNDVLGVGGISQEFNEDNLGGTAARFRVMVGR
jgi:outer membrane protein W